MYYQEYILYLIKSALHLTNQTKIYNQLSDAEYLVKKTKYIN